MNTYVLSPAHSSEAIQQPEIQYRELYDNVLTTISQLAIADSQSLTSLVESMTLIPSLVSFIYNVTSVIWSETAAAERDGSSHATW